MGRRADLLLLNAGNYPGLPIYPYAFVQVSAIARRHGITVRRLDLLGTDIEQWPHIVAKALAETAPLMIGIHLRQADSLFIWDYAPPGKPGMPASAGRDYFPVDDTARLVSTVRRLTDVPVVIGGFGFTTHARRLVDRLAPDFGIQGEPDDFFAHFHGLLSGSARVAAVDNLIHRGPEGYVFNPRVFYGPAPHREYDEEIFADLCAFYGTPGVFAPDGAHVAVELSRGCPHRCYFCTEPLVKGRGTRVRDLDVVMEDVSFLAARGIRRVWLICSEINIGGNALPLRVAERMREFAAASGTAITWSAYFLPNPGLNRAEIRLLLDSGFQPGWNQFMSYDDENLKRTRVPYRARHALRAQLDWAAEQQEHAVRTGASPRGHRLDMFLGNAYADASTVATTLAALNDEDVTAYFDSGLITRATRVFEQPGGTPPGEDGTVFSIGPHGELAKPDTLYPTFHYPEDLVRRLGGRDAVDEFFGYVEETFFSQAHRKQKDWLSFLAGATTPARFATWCRSARAQWERFELRGASDELLSEVARLAAEACSGDGIRVVREVFAPPEERRPVLGLTAYVLIQAILEDRAEEVAAVLKHLGLAQTNDGVIEGSAYDLLRVLSTRFEDEGRLLGSVHEELPEETFPAASFITRHLLYDRNLRLIPAYVDIIFHGRAKGDAHAVPPEDLLDKRVRRPAVQQPGRRDPRPEGG